MSDTAVTPALFDRAGAARYLSISLTGLRRLADAKEIEKVSVAGSPRYTRKSLDAYVARLSRGAR